MSAEIACPQCTSDVTYFDGHNQVCTSCFFEWDPSQEPESNERVWKDAFGNVLQNGDSVTLIKPLKVKGSSITLKQGTKIKNILLVEGDHDVDCKIDGQSFSLKSEFLKKA